MRLCWWLLGLLLLIGSPLAVSAPLPGGKAAHQTPIRATCSPHPGEMDEGEATVRLSQLTTSLYSDQLARIVHDPTGALSPQQALMRAQTEGVAGIERFGGGYWLIWPLCNDTPQSDWVLSSYNVLYSEMEFKLLVEGQVAYQLEAGRLHPRPQTSALQVFGWHFPFTIAPQQRALLMVRVETAVLNPLSFHWQPAEVAIPEQLHRQVRILLGLGMMLALVVYSLVLSASLRDLNFIWYGLHGTALLMWVANSGGILHSLNILADAELYQARLLLIAQQIFALLFCHQFLNIAQRSHFLHRLLQVTLVALLIFFITAALTDSPLLALPLQGGSIAVFFLLFMAGAHAVWQGYRPARYYLAGWLGISLGMVTGALQLRGIIPSIPDAYERVLLGSVFEMLMLALALADRIRILQREKGVAEAAAEAQSAFIATVSHELRTPLHAILGMTYKLSQGPLDAAQQTSARTILSAGNTLLGFINDILDYARLTAGPIKPQQIRFDPRELLGDLKALIAVSAADKGLTLSQTIDERLPASLIGDPERLKQVLLNLLANAVKFTQQGGVVLGVELVETEGEQLLLRFSVQDSGIGISTQQGLRLFKRFSQAGGHIGRRFGGTGLGLAICKELVETMGGHIGYTSQPGKGSTFFVELRFGFSTSAPSTHATLPHDAAPDFSFARGLRLLAVDDVPVNLAIIEAAFKDVDCTLHCVDGGRAALAQLQRTDYDLILMDLFMPDMDGLTATRRIRADSNPRTAQIPIVGVTANALPRERERCLMEGMNEMLSKPFTLKELERTLRHVLGRPEEIQAIAEPLLDSEHLRIQQEDMGSEAQGRLFIQFAELGEHYLEAITLAHQQADPAALTAQLHRLRGMAAMCGCAALAQEIEQHETRIAAADQAALSASQLAALTSLYQASAAALQRLVS